MSAVECWRCRKNFAKDKVLDIPVFHKGRTIKWCFNCVNKQLKIVGKVIANKEDIIKK